MKRWFSMLVAAVVALGACAGAAQAGYVSASTPLGTSSARISNIRLAADAVNGTSLAYGEAFSFNDIVGARTASRGYQSAVNGRGVKVVGGGVAQVASTLYLALQQAGDIDYTELRTYGNKYNQDYVDSASDAVLIDDEAQIDFSFVNYAGDMTIEAYTSGDWLYVSLNFDSFEGSGAVLGRSEIYVSGTSSLFNNVELAALAIDGVELFDGDLFSFNDIVGARTKDRGYESAVNGRGAKVTGGGVAQVASAVWLAVKDRGDISIVEKSTYGSKYNQDYVSSASDAILTDYGSGKDFSFRYTGSGSIRISTYLSGDTLVCEIRAVGPSSGGNWSAATEPPSQGWWW